MAGRYKDDTFHMLQTFNNTAKKNAGFGLTSQSKTQNLRGKNGSTWDALHMTKFLNQSNYSNWSRGQSSMQSTNYQKHNRNRSTNDYFFKTTKDNKNASLIGYTKVNPLIALPETKYHNREVLKQYLKKQSPQRYSPPKPALRQDGKFLFQGNNVKFRITDPLTLQHIQEKKPTGFDKQRLKWLISRRHPHGMTGIDHCQAKRPEFYNQRNDNQGRIRQQPNSHRDHVIDKNWKSKGRVNQTYKQEYGFAKANFIQERKFRNDDTHGYNIITNCQTHR